MKLERKIKNFIKRSIYSLYHFFYLNKSKVPPQKFYDSFLDYSRNFQNVIIKEINPSFIFNRKPPKCIYDYADDAFLEILRMKSSGDNLYKLPNVRVFGEEGLIITPDNCLIKENFIDGKHNLTDHPIKHRYNLPKEKNLEGNTALIAQKWSDCYYHWMLEIIPKFNLLDSEKTCIDYYVLNKFKFPFQQTSLKNLGLDLSKIIFIDNETMYKAENLITTSVPGEVGNPPRWALDFLKEKFKPNKFTNYPEKIYISRKNAKYRRLINENDTLKVLETKDFKTIYPEELSLQEQINTFFNAKVIITTHGAGLTNLVFASDNVKVLELFSPDYVNVCYWAISNEKNIDYYYLKGREKLDNYDILLDMDELIKTLDMMGI